MNDTPASAGQFAQVALVCYCLACLMLPVILLSPFLRRLLIGCCIAAATGYGIVLVFLRAPRFRDFDIHREIGQWFLSDQNLYQSPVSYPYLPTGAMYFSLLALVDQKIGLALRYLMAIACLWLICVLLHRMFRKQFPEVAQMNVVVSVLALILAGQFILYDLDDGGPHAILLGMLVGAIYATWMGWEKLAATWFGLAIALKVTPALFVPFFLWKRCWRLALYTSVATGCWMILPMIWMGPTSWWNHHQTWVQVAAGSAIGQKTEFARSNEDNVRNSALQPAMMRYLITLPVEHPLRKNDPGYVAVLDLPPAIAQILVIAAMLALLVGFCYVTALPYQGIGDPDWPRECSGLFILMLFLSPLTWIQHLPWLVPALYWVVCKACSHSGLTVPAKLAVGTYVLLTVVLNYEAIGKQNFLLFLGFKPFTLAMLLVFVVLMFRQQTVGTLSPKS